MPVLRLPRAVRVAALVVLVPVLAALLAACAAAGAADDAPGPAATTPEAPAPPAQPVDVGERVAPGASTPKPVVNALQRTADVLVVGFVLEGVADDESVAAELRAMSRRPATSKGVRYFVYEIDDTPRFGDLADMLQIRGTPAVAVIGRDRSLVNLFTGLVDREIVGQAVADAKETEAITSSRPARAAARPKSP